MRNAGLLLLVVLSMTLSVFALLGQYGPRDPQAAVATGVMVPETPLERVDAQRLGVVSITPRVIGSEQTWFKGNLHTHTLWSDGDDFPEIVAEWYSRQGYHFLAMTDHDRLSEGDRWINMSRANLLSRFDRYRASFGNSWVETRTQNGRDQVRLKPLDEFRGLFDKTGTFLLIQGEEITDHFESAPIHVNTINLRDAIPPQGGRSVTETIENDLAAVRAQAKKLGRSVLAIVDHPRFRDAITAEALAEARNARFFEVYNGHPIVSHRADKTHASVERLWDIANTLRLGEMHAPPLYALATDDAHHYFGPGAEPGRGWIMVRATHLTPESILQAMETGGFYASSGVTLRRVDYSREKQSLEVEVVPDDQARYTIQFVGTLAGYDAKREPVTDDFRKVVATTQRYSKDVGRVLATVEGPVARYDLTGQELYVRAVVTSTLPHKNPSLPQQVQEAWTQPVGWEKWVQPQSTPPASGNNR